MDLQLMDQRNSSKCASALCFVFIILLPHLALTVFTSQCQSDWFFAILRQRNLCSEFILFSYFSFQTYGQSPGADIATQNSSSHLSPKAPSNVFASMFFGELKPSLQFCCSAVSFDNKIQEINANLKSLLFYYICYLLSYTLVASLQVYISY